MHHPASGWLGVPLTKTRNPRGVSLGAGRQASLGVRLGAGMSSYVLLVSQFCLLVFLHITLIHSPSLC